jgi:autotransporter-associated beta strand protein
MKASPLRLVLLAAATALAPRLAPAADDIWNQTAAGTFSWDQATNWISGTQFPNGTGDFASLTANLLGAQAVNLNQPITLGTLNLGDSTTAFFAMTLNAGTAGSLIFDAAAGNAVLARTVTVNPNVTDIINAALQLDDSLTVSLPWIGNGNGIRVNGLVTGAGGINVVAPSQPGTAASDAQFLDLVNVANSFAGNLEIGNGVVVCRGSILSAQNSALGNSTAAVKIGNADSRVGTGTPSFAGNTTTELRLQASDDAANHSFTRDLDFSGNTGGAAAMGRARFSMSGDGAGGANFNTLTIGANVILSSSNRGTEFVATRAGQTIYYTGNISTPPGANGTVYWNPLAPQGTSADGAVAGTNRFSDVARAYTNVQNIVNGTIVIEGSVGAVGAASPVGAQTFNLTDGNGGNISGANNNTIGVNPQDARRALFLATPGAVFARNLSPGGGGNSTAYNGGTFTVYNGYQFGGLNTSGTVTFSGLINPLNPSTGINPTNQVITLGQNIALIQAAGGTVEFAGIISDTTSNAHVTRITINQFRNHSQIDTNFDGIPEVTANALAGTPAGGTVVLSAANSFEGGTEILGGTLRVPGSIQRSATIRVAAGTLVLPDNPLNLDRISNSAPVTLGGGLGAASIVMEGTVTEIAGVFTVAGATPSVIDFGNSSAFLVFADSGAAAWTGNLEIRNWSGDATGAGGIDQLVVGIDADALTAGQLDRITFVSPAGFSPGLYGAVLLETGEVVPGDLRLDGIWAQSAAGTYSWDQPTNWVFGTTFPNAVNAIAHVNTNLAGAQTINLNQPITVGTLNLGDSAAPLFGITIQPGGGSLDFDVAFGNARLARTVAGNPGVNDAINADVTLSDPLAVSLPWAAGGNGIQINGLVSGPGGINVTMPAQPSPASTPAQLVELTNQANSFSGNLEIGNGVVVYRGSVPAGQNSALGNSTAAIKIGNSSTLTGSGTPSFASIPTMELRMVALDDSSDHTFSRDLDFSGPTGSVNAVGRARFVLAGNGAGGANSNTLTVSGNITVTSSNRGIEFAAQRLGQSLYFTGNILSPAGASGNLIFGGGTAPAAASVDGPMGGSYRFSDLARNYVNPQFVTMGAAIIEGSVGPVGAPSPVGQQTFSLSDGNGGNITSVNAQDGRRGIFLATPGAGFARALALGDGTTSATYNGGSFRVHNGYTFGGLNSVGTVTFSGAISCNNPATGANPTNQVITLGHNLALLAATGGTAEFSGPISDTPSGANNTRVTINQFRAHAQIDSNVDGIPDPGVANMLIGTAQGGTVILSGTNTYEGGTEVLGGTLLVRGNSGTGPGPVLVRTNATLGGTGVISGAVTFHEGSHAQFTNGAVLALQGALAVSNGVDVRLNIPANLGPGSYTLATFNTNGSTGSFASTPVIDSGSINGTGVIITSNGLVVLEVTGGSLVPPAFPPGSISTLPGGAVSLTVTGAPGTAWRLWTSTNVAAAPVISTWTLLTNGTIGASPFPITDSTATNFPQRFYLFSTP